MNHKDREKMLENNLDIINKILDKINCSFCLNDMQGILDSILETTVDTLGFEFATIQMVDYLKNTISTVMGMKNRRFHDAVDPSRWMGESHALNPKNDPAKDIHAWLLQDYKKELIIKGWHSQFDEAIYDKYNHDKLIRAFIPIIAREPEMYIGTLEAGYSIRNKDYIDEVDIKMLKCLANAAAIAIRNHANMSEKIEYHKSRQIVNPELIEVIEKNANIITLLSVNKHPLSVFLCHSSGDKSQVQDLYHRLISEGIDPWFDEEKLLPGHDWDEEIKKAVRNCNIALVCLSKESVNKAGYVQKEIHYALDVADEQPENSIFIIPLRFEDCKVPNRLSRWHWVDLYEEGGYEKLMKALKHKAIQLDLLNQYGLTRH